jgi:hypothetical protein
MIEDVARHDAAEQNDDFGRNQRCRQNLDDSAKQGVERRRHGAHD